MEWSDELDIGVDSMNREHKSILEIMNQLHDGVQQNKDFSELKSLLVKLEEITIVHFKDEEEFMQKMNFSKYDSHKIIHTQLLKQLTEHKENILSTEKIEDKFFIFLKTWLSAHIKGIDVKYGDEYNHKSV